MRGVGEELAALREERAALVERLASASALQRAHAQAQAELSRTRQQVEQLAAENGRLSSELEARMREQELLRQQDEESSQALKELIAQSDEIQARIKIEQEACMTSADAHIEKGMVYVGRVAEVTS